MTMRIDSTPRLVGFRMPGTLPGKAGDRMAASNLNYYTCNGGLHAPKVPEAP